MINEMFDIVLLVLAVYILSKIIGGGHHKKILLANKRTVMKYLYHHPEYHIEYMRFLLTTPQAVVVKLARDKGAIDTETVALHLKINLKSAKLMLVKLAEKEYLNCHSVRSTENKTSNIYTPSDFGSRAGIRYSKWWKNI